MSDLPNPRAIAASLTRAYVTEECLLCGGTGKVTAYRGPTDRIYCVCCDGRGFIDRHSCSPLARSILQEQDNG